MMQLTAALQINVELLPGAAGVEQWLAANLAGPSLISAFSNTPRPAEGPATGPQTRTAIWRGVDMRRTGY